jgi:hypothetical protein
MRLLDFLIIDRRAVRICYLQAVISLVASLSLGTKLLQPAPGTIAAAATKRKPSLNTLSFGFCGRTSGHSKSWTAKRISYVGLSIRKPRVACDYQSGVKENGPTFVNTSMLVSPRLVCAYLHVTFQFFPYVKVVNESRCSSLTEGILRVFET